MNNWTVLIYYIYCLLVIFATGYVVFELNHSGWWFLLALLLCNSAPETKKEKDE
jgi:hypothetical protein